MTVMGERIDLARITVFLSLSLSLSLTSAGSDVSVKGIVPVDSIGGRQSWRRATRRQQFKVSATGLGLPFDNPLLQAEKGS